MLLVILQCTGQSCKQRIFWPKIPMVPRLKNFVLHEYMPNCTAASRVELGRNYTFSKSFISVGISFNELNYNQKKCFEKL